LILGTLLFYFYKEVAFKVFIWMYIMVGFWTFIYAREAYHIGASGLLYGLFSFLLISGFIRKNKHLISLSFAVIFLYGSLVWGIFPIDVKISFEGHLWGFVAGLILAIFYRKKGNKTNSNYWQDKDDLDDKNPYWLEGIEIQAKEDEDIMKS
jgi:membrane associated rhomboid family serine protease